MNEVVKHLRKADEAMHTAWAWLPMEEREIAKEGQKEILLAIGEYILEDMGNNEVLNACRNELAKTKEELKKLKATIKNNED